MGDIGRIASGVIFRLVGCAAEIAVRRQKKQQRNKEMTQENPRVVLAWRFHYEDLQGWQKLEGRKAMNSSQIVGFVGDLRLWTLRKDSVSKVLQKAVGHGSHWMCVNPVNERPNHDPKAQKE